MIYKIDIGRIDLFNSRIIPASARTGEGLLDGIDWIVHDISSRIFVSN